jgi:GTP-binding protein
MIKPALAGTDVQGSKARRALAWIHGARFVASAAQLDQLPDQGLPEIAFVGRSNAGKSSAINALAEHRQLAYASRTPGRTQHINLFALGPRSAPDALFADLPGYGFARVAREAKRRWQKVMTDYLAVRHQLRGVVLLVDSRLGLSESDLEALALIGERVHAGQLGLLVLLTKADKLNRTEARGALVAAQAQLGPWAGDASDIGLTLFSALRGEGVADAAVVLHRWAHR